MVRRLIFLVVIAMLGVGCVSNKKFVLLQKGDVNRNDMPIDTIVRSYQPVKYEYKIQPEDLLSVRIESLTPKDLDFLSQGASTNNLNLTPGNALLIGELVDHEGFIPFPFIGKVKVSGMTLFEIQNTLQKMAEQYLEQPIVKVRFINFRFTVLGEVKNEGTITVGNNRITILEALGLAGGMTDLAERSRVKLIRQQHGKTEVVYINLLKEDFIDSPYYYLHQSDVLVVSSLKQRPYQKYFGQNLALFVSTVSLVLLTVSLFSN